MIIRLMTLATILMLVACLMIGVTVALAGSARAAETDADKAAAFIQHHPIPPVMWENRMAWFSE